MQQVPLGEQEILFPIWNFQWALGCPIFSFLCSISSTIVLSVFLLFVFILSVLLRLWSLITPFGIFKLFVISTCNNYLNRCYFFCLNTLYFSVLPMAIIVVCTIGFIIGIMVYRMHRSRK